MSLKVKALISFIVFDQTIRNHRQFLFLPYFLQKVVVVYEQRRRDKRVEVTAITIYVILLAFYCDLACEIYTGLFEAKLFGTIDGLPINEGHMLLK